VDHSTVVAAWKAYGIKPWKAETFKFSTDPELVAKVTDVVGLYLARRYRRGSRERSILRWRQR
jgi:hypothetical protein